MPPDASTIPIICSSRLDNSLSDYCAFTVQVILHFGEPFNDSAHASTESLFRQIPVDHLGLCLFTLFGLRAVQTSVRAWRTTVITAIAQRNSATHTPLISKGIDLTDVRLIASCLATPGTQIWTIDPPLGRVTESLGIRAKLP